MRREPSVRPENLLAKALDDIERLKEWKSRVGDGRGLVIASGTGSGSTTPTVEAGEHVLYGSKHTNSLRVTDGGGLVVEFESGQVVLVTDQVRFFSVPSGTLTLTDNATNYVFVNSSGTVTSNTTGFPEDGVMLAEVVTSGGGIVSISDRRAYLHSHHVKVHDIDGSDHTGTLDVGDLQLPAPPVGYPADIAATKADGTSTRVARADHVHAHGSGYLPDAHHQQAHGDSDHTGPSRVTVQDDGVAVGSRATLNFTGAGVSVSDDSTNLRINIDIPGGGGGSGGHQIQEDGTALPQRTGLNFAAGLVASDNQASDRTDVNVDYGTAADVANVDASAAASGSLLRVARADHKHGVSVATAVDLGNDNSAGSAAALARADHVHRRSVRVKSGTSDLARNALNVSGLGVVDDAANDEIDIVHDASSSGHHPQAHAIDSADHTGTLDIGDAQLPAPPAGYAADVAAARADGTSTRAARADHVHAHGTGYLPDAHHPQAHDHSAPADGDTLSPAVLNLPQAASPVQTAEGQVVWDSTNDKLTVGDGTGRKIMAREDQAVMDGDAAGGELAGTYPNPSVATVHAGSAHHAQVHAIDGSDHTGTLDIGDAQLPAPSAGYPANVAAASADGTSARVARADHVHAHGSGYLPDAHHPQAHGDSDHTGPSRVAVQDEGVAVAARTTLNFVGDGVTVSDDAQNDRVNINIAGGGGAGGHQIQEDGTALPQRSGLNFAAGLVASDNQTSDRIDVNINYGVTSDVSNVGANTNNKSAGVSSRVARADHVHVASTTVAVGLGEANAAGTSSFLSRSDHVHKRSVRVKSGTSNFVRKALNISGLGVTDDATNDEIDIIHDASSSGHHDQVHDAGDHSGVIGKVYTTLLWYIDGTVATGDGQGATPYLEDDVDKVRIRAAVDTAPVGQDLIAEVNHSTDRTTWTVVDTVTIAAGSTTGETTLSTGTLQSGWYRLDINQVGSTTAGSDLTVMFVCKRPVTAS